MWGEGERAEKGKVFMPKSTASRRRKLDAEAVRPLVMRLVMSALIPRRQIRPQS